MSDDEDAPREPLNDVRGGTLAATAVADVLGDVDRTPSVGTLLRSGLRRMVEQANARQEEGVGAGDVRSSRAWRRAVVRMAIERYARSTRSEGEDHTVVDVAYLEVHGRRLVPRLVGAVSAAYLDGEAGADVSDRPADPSVEIVIDLADLFESFVRSGR